MCTKGATYGAQPPIQMGGVKYAPQSNKAICFKHLA